MAPTTYLIHRSLVLPSLILLIILTIAPYVDALEPSSLCDDTSVKNVVSSCEAYVVGSNPQPMPDSDNACCSSLHVTPFSCLCSRAASSMSYLSSLINQQAMKNVMQTCGVEIPASNSKCSGSHTRSLI